MDGNLSAGLERVRELVGEDRAQHLRELLERNEGLTPLSGLEELTEEQRAEAQRSFDNLRAALLVFSRAFPDLEALVARRTQYEQAAILLKLMAVSAINLLDLPAPSLPPLEAEEGFAIDRPEGGFRVF